MGKLSWNPSLDPKELRRDFLRRTFGPAAEAVGEFYDVVRSAWTADKTPSRYDDDVFETAASASRVSGASAPPIVLISRLHRRGR